MVEIVTSSPEALRVRANTLLNAQAYEDAERLARAGLARFPDDRGLRTALALSLLGQGRYRDGFREYEIREPRAKAPAHGLPYPEWSGPIAGRSIVVWGEQGIGDEFMMGRYVRTLRDLGASHLTLTCWPQSIRAFEQLGADRVISRFGAVELPKHDCWISALSIPYRLGLDLSDISGGAYLKAEPRGSGGIGLVDRGRPDNPQDAERSIPAGLLQAAFPEGQILQPEGDTYDSMCRIAGLDLLITVDTSWAHMAGALGVPCWVLLPYRGLDWRWMRERSDSPWYSSIRLFRQPTPGAWGAVLADVADALGQSSRKTM